MFLMINKKLLIHGSAIPIWSAVSPGPPGNIVLVLVVDDAFKCFGVN